MRRLWIAGVMLLVLAAARAKAEGFEVTLASGVDPQTTVIDYHLFGDFGTAGGEIDGTAGIQTYFIPIAIRGQKASRLKAVILSPGCDFATINDAALATSRKRELFECNAMPKVPLVGQIPKEAAFAGKDLVVTLAFKAYWVCGFYHLADCKVPMASLGKAVPDHKGVFDIMLPDYSERYGGSAIALRVRDAKTGGILAALTPVNMPSVSGDLPVAAHYPRRVLFAKASAVKE